MRTEQNSAISRRIFGIFEQLGLKLEPQRAPVDIFIIEHVEKPTEN